MKSYLKLHLLLFMYSLGAVCSKLASEQEFLSIRFCMYYLFVLLILFGYAVAWQQILKQISLNSAYPSKAVTIIWGLLWGILFFSERLVISNIIGALMIIIGIYVVVKSDEE